MTQEKSEVATAITTGDESIVAAVKNAVKSEIATDQESFAATMETMPQDKKTKGKNRHSSKPKEVNPAKEFKKLIRRELGK